MNSYNDTIISIVTPSFNQAQFISETIQSVLAQKGDFYIDYIIMDGASSDESVGIIKKYEEKLKENSSIRKINGTDFYISNDKNNMFNSCQGISYRWFSKKDNGQADGINQGLKLAIGNIYAFLNSDDVYYPDTFSEILRLNWNKIDFSYGEGMWINSESKDLCLYPTNTPDKYTLFYRCTLCQPAIFFKKETFLSLGNFDNYFFCGFDYEYWLRAVFSGKKFKYINKVLAKSRMYQKNKSLSNKDVVADNHKELMKKYYSNIKLNKFILNFKEYFNRKYTRKHENRMHDLVDNS